MIESIIVAAAAFTAGLVYSKGKKDPLGTALKDAARLAGKGVQAAAGWIRRKATQTE